jgi:hypothetical protein
MQLIISFEANEIQLKGPVPNELYHRYVEFKTFIGGMFRGTGIRGRVLQKALHHQHQNIYVFNNRTEHGTIEGPSREMTLQFLRMAHFDEGGRTFTYVITLDGLMRFTETGAEFGIDMLSKHTMHSDVNVGNFQKTRRLGLMTELHCILWRVPHPSLGQPRPKRRRRGPKDPPIR